MRAIDATRVTRRERVSVTSNEMMAIMENSVLKATMAEYTHALF